MAFSFGPDNAGRFNVARGIVITAQGVETVLSTTPGRLAVVNAGDRAAFLAFGAIGFAICPSTLPETAMQSTSTSRRASGSRRPGNHRSVITSLHKMTQIRLNCSFFATVPFRSRPFIERHAKMAIDASIMSNGFNILSDY